MITQEPKPGDKLEYYQGAGWMDIKSERLYWKYVGEVTIVEGNICYFKDIESPEDGDKYFKDKPEGTNNCFIWRFHDTNNKLFRIKV